MVSARIGICLAAVGWALACGERPDLPGPAAPSGDGPSGAGSASGDGGSGGEVTVLESQPRPDPNPPAADAGRPDGGDDAPPADDPGPTVLACTEVSGGCVTMKIAVSDGDADTCIQLTLDDCESAAQPGLPVTLPVPWRLGAASVSRSAEGCVPGAPFNPMTTNAIVDASGSINWNLTTRQPSQIVLDLTLEPSRMALDTTPISLANSDLVDPLPECE